MVLPLSLKNPLNYYSRLFFWVAFLAVFYPFFTMVFNIDGAQRLLFLSELFLTGIMLMTRKRNRVFWQFPVGLFATWWLWTVIMCIYWQRDMADCGPDILFSFMGIGMFAVYSQLNRDEILSSIRGIVWACYLVMIIALLTGNVRATAKELVKFNTNDLAYLLSLGGVFMLLLMKWGKIPKFRALLLGAIVLLVIVRCGSKKAFIGDCLFLVLLLCSVRPWKLFSLRRLSMAILILAVGFMVYDSIGRESILAERMKDFMENYDNTVDFEKQYEGRGRFYVLGWDVFKEHPMGCGFHAYSLFSGDRLTAHTDYICVLVDSGIVGAICYFAVYLLLLVRLFKAALIQEDAKKREELEVFLFGTVMILATALGRWNYIHAPTYIFLGLAYSMWRCDTVGDKMALPNQIRNLSHV